MNLALTEGTCFGVSWSTREMCMSESCTRHDEIAHVDEKGTTSGQRQATP